jgi:NADPH-dependent 2,4-dienoyl-CoA reductase/sulfur reductase-like enzyme
VETVFDAHVDPALVERSLAASTLGSMWLDIERPQYPSLTGSINCDRLVIGGGYTGLWAALHAAQRNPDHRIVHRSQPHRLGGIRPKRRLRRRQPDSRRRVRKVPLAQRN